MRKIVILTTILCMILGVTGCSKGTENFNEQKGNEVKEEKYLTDEEMIEISNNLVENIEKNTQYRFAKVVAVDGTKIKVLYTNEPLGYKVKGYNEDLDIDVSKLKETNEEGTIDLIGVTSNILPDNIGDVSYVRIGIYESDEDNGEQGLTQGTVVSVDEIK